MRKHKSAAIRLLAVIVLSVTVVNGWAQEDLAPADEPIQLEQATQSDNPAILGQSALDDAEANRKKLLDLLAQLGRSNHDLGTSNLISPELSETLLKQMDEAQQQLDDARTQSAGSSQAATLDLAQQMLDLMRAQLVNDSSAEVGEGAVTMGSDEQSQFVKNATQQELDYALQRLDYTQQQLDEARAVLGESPGDANTEQLLKQLDASQEKLDQMKKEIQAGIE